MPHFGMTSAISLLESVRLAPKRCAACPVLVFALLRFTVRFASFYARAALGIYLIC